MTKFGKQKLKLLGITIDNELKFDEYFTQCLPKSVQEIISTVKTRILFKRCFKSQFRYCLLTWMFYSRNTNNEISLLHERSPRLVYNDYESPFAKLLEKTVLLLSIIITFRHCALNCTKYKHSSNNFQLFNIRFCYPSN